MSYKRLEKHNILQIVEKNSLLEFTKQDLVKLCEYSNYRDYYSTYNVENLLQELVNEGSLGVYYISVKVEPLRYNYGYSITDYKVGSKSVAVYKSLKAMRNERIDELLK
jgi:hypothetical protein